MRLDYNDADDSNYDNEKQRWSKIKNDWQKEENLMESLSFIFSYLICYDSVGDLSSLWKSFSIFVDLL